MLKTKALRNQKGTAMVEVVPLLVIFVLLINFSLGFFGVIHAGILNSIAARNYAFETFRNRAVLNYLRDIADSDDVTYRREGFRFHGIKIEGTRSGLDIGIAQFRSLYCSYQCSIRFGSQPAVNQVIGDVFLQLGIPS